MLGPRWAVNWRRYKHNPFIPKASERGVLHPAEEQQGLSSGLGTKVGSSGKIKIQGEGKLHKPDGSITEVMGSASPQGLWLPAPCWADGDGGVENSQG